MAWTLVPQFCSDVELKRSARDHCWWVKHESRSSLLCCCDKESLQGSCADWSVLLTEQDCPGVFYVVVVCHEDQCMLFSNTDSSDQFYVYMLQPAMQLFSTIIGKDG